MGDYLIEVDRIASELYTETDKFVHGYYPYYCEIARALRHKANVLEVGVWLGGSLRLWQRLFPEGRIAGADDFSTHLAANVADNWPGGTLKIVSEQTNPYLKEAALDWCPQGYDLVIDDASHYGSKSKATYDLLWPIVKPGGFYVLEDWFVGERWSPAYPHYEGTSMSDLAVSFMNQLNPDSDVADIRYVNSGGGMAILRKKSK